MSASSITTLKFKFFFLPFNISFSRWMDVTTSTLTNTLSFFWSDGLKSRRIDLWLSAIIFPQTMYVRSSLQITKTHFFLPSMTWYDVEEMHCSPLYSSYFFHLNIANFVLILSLFLIYQLLFYPVHVEFENLNNWWLATKKEKRRKKQRKEEEEEEQLISL